MKPWYEESFGQEYLTLYAHRDDAEARADIQMIVKLLAPPMDAPLLDLCCGAGRHMLALRELGFQDLIGLDLSADLLRVAAKTLRQNVPQPTQRTHLVRADMRRIPYRDYFATTLSLFTSFGYFDVDDENRAVITGVYRALRPGGVFLIDTMNRDYVIANLVPSDEKTISDRHVRSVRCLTEDCQRVEKTTVVTSKSGQQHTFHESVRLYSLADMQGMLQDAGFVNIRSYGALNGASFSPQSKRLILISYKPTPPTKSGGQA